MIRVFEAFAGYGSQRMALRNLGIPFEVVGISEIVEDVLRDINANGKPIIGVYNKCDLISENDILTRVYQKSVFISAKKNLNIDALIEAIYDTAPGKKQELHILIPYSDARLLDELHTNQKVLSEEYTGDGIEIKLLADSIVYDKLKKYEI